MNASRHIRPFGDTGLLIGVADIEEAHRLAAAVLGAQWPGVEDVVVGFDAVTVIVDPTVANTADLAAVVAALPTAGSSPPNGRLVEIGVRFDGEDLDDVAALCSLSGDQVVALLTSCDLLVAFLGFAPGFAYLVGLPPALAAIARRRTPRPTVPCGAVALGGGFAGIYPRSSPGGWQLLGSSDVRLFDPQTPPFALLAPGDRVRFLSDERVGSAPTRRPRERLETSNKRRVTVESPGLLSLVEDQGRVGSAALGVTRSGGADPFSLRIANKLLGNDESAAALEITASGPSLRFGSDAHCGVVGDVETQIDGHAIPTGAVVPVKAGQLLSVGRVRRGLRAYLAVGGGIETPRVLGSRSSDLFGELGPGALVVGDVLGLGAGTRPRGQLLLPVPQTSSPIRLRVLPGPDLDPRHGLDALSDMVWEVQADSDRVGLRLRGDEPLSIGTIPATSRGMVTGAIQLPPDGEPVVLLCDHATVGGYPVIAVVASADLGILGQCRPGDVVRIDIIDMADAARARARRERAIDEGVIGWFPVRSD